MWPRSSPTSACSRRRCSTHRRPTLFADTGPRGIAALSERPADGLVPWPSAGAVTTWAEAVRIVLLESTVHLLADLADPVAFVDAATGRSSASPLPVVR
jgi:hypothetical protein